MQRVFGNPWFMLFFFPMVSVFSISLMKGWAISKPQLIAAALLGFSLAVVNLFDFFFSNSNWLAAFLNGIIGAVTGVIIANLLDKTFEISIWCLGMGALLGVSARFWIRYI